MEVSFGGFNASTNTIISGGEFSESSVMRFTWTDWEPRLFPWHPLKFGTDPFRLHAPVDPRTPV